MYDRSVCFAWAFSEERCYTANLSVIASQCQSSQKRYHTTNLSVIASQCQLVPKALSHDETSQSKPFGFASSPIRGATGVPVLVLLDELSFLNP